MDAMVIASLFFFGLFFGSFIAILSDRLPQGEGVILGRSHCDYCNHNLEARDLIPLLSFALLQGRCRYCKKKLSYWYPAVELASGAILAGTYIWMGRVCSESCTLYTGLFSILILTFLALFVADAKYHILPDQLIVLGVLTTIMLRLGPSAFDTGPVPIIGENLLYAIITGIGLVLFFLALFIGTKGRGMGFGDVKLAFLIGFLLGFPLGFIAIYLAFLTGGAVAAILILGQQKKFGQHIAFGPFMLFGTVLSLLYSEYILRVIHTFL